MSSSILCTWQCDRCKKSEEVKMEWDTDVEYPTGWIRVYVEPVTQSTDVVLLCSRQCVKEWAVAAIEGVFTPQGPIRTTQPGQAGVG